MGLDYLIAVLFFTASKVDLITIQLIPKRFEEVMFVDSKETSRDLISNLEKLSKQSNKFRICIVQTDDMYDSPLSDAIRPLLLEQEKEFPGIYTSYKNVNNYANRKANDLTPTKQDVLSYCLGTIPRALP